MISAFPIHATIPIRTTFAIHATFPSRNPEGVPTSLRSTNGDENTTSLHHGINPSQSVFNTAQTNPGIGGPQKISQRGADPQIRAGRLRPAQSEMPTGLESERVRWAFGSPLVKKDATSPHRKINPLQGVFNTATPNARANTKMETKN